MSLLPVGIGPQEGGYQIERSLRFNSADSTSLNRTPGSASNRKTWTWSGWVKRCEISTDERTFFGAGTDANNFTALAWINDALYLQNYTGGSQVVTNTTAVFRDASAWYHIVLALDTTQATAANRAKIYVNGVQQVGFSGSSFSLNQDFWVNFTYAHRIGSRQLSSADSFSNQYMTEINFIDGSALDPTSFGEYNEDTGVWQPKAYTGSYGSNGFRLSFSDNSGVTSTTLGADSSGNGNNWTPNNFSVTAGAGNDSLVDTPTNYGTDTGVGGEVRGNYCTMNPLDSTFIAVGTLSEGNLRFAQTSSGARTGRGTFGISNGKWYWEYTHLGGNSSPGIVNLSANLSTYVGGDANGWSYFVDGNKYTNNAATAYGASYTTNDIIGVAFDADAGTLVFYKNGVSQGTAFSSLSANTYFPAVSTSSVSNVTCVLNFGQRPFAYTAPSGFKALCTQNLPEPTIADGGQYFNTVLYTGNGSTQSITGVGFQPDWVWIKRRAGDPNILGNGHHSLYDFIRGATKELYSDLTSGEATNAGSLTAFNADGFSLGAENRVNANTQPHVAWNWKANGAGASNTAGTITSTVSANTDSGFSIVTYTGTGAAATVGHGLGAVPAMIIVKCRSAANDWGVYHVGNTVFGSVNFLRLNTTSAAINSPSAWNSTAPTSSVFTVGTLVDTNQSGATLVAYCFAAIPGYSAFGSYTGNGSADGPFVYTGFRPAWIMRKQVTNNGDVGGWVIFDNSRDPYNVATKRLLAQSSNAEATPGNNIDILSNGWKERSSDGYSNASGQTFIYMAFAENPFKYSLAR